MRHQIAVFVSCLFLLSLMITGCAGVRDKKPDTAPPALNSVDQIDSFNPKVASRQGLEVVNSNPYSQEFFEQVFNRVAEQCRNSKSPDNADIIWTNFVMPLRESGKVPPDLAKTTWNYYFSMQFVSLPSRAVATNYCMQLSAIKKNLEKEYQCKKLGFEVCEQGSPDAHFLNAMYVYNTMWAACKAED